MLGFGVCGLGFRVRPPFQVQGPGGFLGLRVLLGV